MTFHLIIPLFAVFLNLVLAFLVFQQGRGTRAGRVFLLCLLSMASWGFTIYLMRASPGLERAFFWEKWVFAVFPAIAIFYFHFTTLFSRIKLARWIVPSSYLVAIVCASLSPTGLVVTGMQIKPYGYAFVFGPLIYPYWVALYGLVIAGLIFILRAMRTSTSADERNRAGYIASGTVLVLVGIVTDALPVLGVPLYPMGIIGNIFFALIVTIAIIRYRLLDIRVVARRGIYYFLSRGFVFGLAVVCIFLINSMFPQEIPLVASLGVVVVIYGALPSIGVYAKVGGQVVLP